MKKYVLKLELEDTNIWRRVSFTSGIGFYDLHSIIQIIFGWEDYHLYEFTVGNMAIGMLGDDEDIDDNRVHKQIENARNRFIVYRLTRKFFVQPMNERLNSARIFKTNRFGNVSNVFRLERYVFYSDYEIFNADFRARFHIFGMRYGGINDIKIVFIHGIVFIFHTRVSVAFFYEHKLRYNVRKQFYGHRESYFRK